MSRLKIVCPDGIAQHAQITVDGEPLVGVVRAVIRLDVDDVVKVELVCEMAHIDLDMGAVERFFEGSAT